MMPTFEAASAGDLDVIRAMLVASSLPADDVDEHVTEFILGEQEGVTVGTVAAEYAGDAALLRSLVWPPATVARPSARDYSQPSKRELPPGAFSNSTC